MRWLALLCLAGCDKLLLPAEHDAAIDAPQCPTGYMPLEGETSQYKLTPTASFEWSSVELTCRYDDPTRSHLLVLRDDIEGFRLANLAKAMQPSQEFFWVGAKQDATATMLDAGWTWITGGPVNRTLWAMGEPNDSDSVEDHLEDRGVISPNDMGRLTDLSATYILPLYGICECDGIPVM